MGQVLERLAALEGWRAGEAHEENSPPSQAILDHVTRECQKVMEAHILSVKEKAQNSRGPLEMENREWMASVEARMQGVEDVCHRISANPAFWEEKEEGGSVGENGSSPPPPVVSSPGEGTFKGH